MAKLSQEVRDVFEKFRKDPIEQFRVKVRQFRAKQIQKLLSMKDLSLDEFNREIWRFETRTRLDGQDITGEIFNKTPLPERITVLGEALRNGSLEFHGNYVWGSATKILAPMVKDDQEKLKTVHAAVEILNDQGLSPTSKAEKLMNLKGFGENISTGLVMLFHPTEFEIYNEKSKKGIGLLEGKTSTLEVFEAEATRFREELGAADFFELDWFLYLVSQGTIPISPDLVHVVLNLREKHCPEQRITERVQAEEQARKMIETKVGAFDENDLRQFFKLVNIDFWKGITRKDRFGQAYLGNNVKELVTQMDGVNDWIKRIWGAPENEIEMILDDYYRQKPLKNAGIAFPSLILYLREPSRYNLIFKIMEKWLEDRTGFKRRPYSGKYYLDYNKEVDELKSKCNLKPQEMDIILSQNPPLVGNGTEIITVEKCSEKIGIRLDILNKWVNAIERKGQAIIYGPPGTGKTYVARELANCLIDANDGFVSLVQFHPSYAYEDFILGLRPITTDGRLKYQMVPGRFLEFCVEAEARQGVCVLIIDEINRANLSRVFGELMYLLEYRDEEIPLAGGKLFKIPANVRIIATMNTADRSIALVDHALRRRFAFLPLYPDYEILRRYHAKTGSPFDPSGLINVLQKLNRQIEDRNYTIGPSYFLRTDVKKHLEDIWQMEIEPYLDEYFFDQPARAQEYRWDKVKTQILP